MQLQVENSPPEPGDDDPGLFWILDDLMVHRALGLPGAPVQQGMSLLPVIGEQCEPT